MHRFLRLAVCFAVIPAATSAAADVPELDPVKVLPVFQRTSESIAISNDGKRMAVSGVETEAQANMGKGLVRILDVKTEKTLFELEARNFSVPPVVFSPDGKQLLYANSFRTAMVATGKPIGELTRKDGSQIGEFAAGYTSNGKSIWTFAYQELVEFDAKTLNESRSIKTTGRQVSTMAVLGGPKLLAAGFQNAGIRLYNLTNLKETVLDPGTETEPKPGDIAYGKPLEFAVSPDNKLMAVSRFDREIELWDLDSRKKVRELGVVDDRVDAMVFLGDGKGLVALGKWTLPNGKDLDFEESSRLNGHPLTVFDVTTGKPTAYLRLQTDKKSGWHIWSMALAPDKKSLYVAAPNGSVQVFDVSLWAGK